MKLLELMKHSDLIKFLLIGKMLKIIKTVYMLVEKIKYCLDAISIFANAVEDNTINNNYL